MEPGRCFHVVAAICLLLTFAACATPSQNIYYKKGKHIRDRIEPGAIDHFEYKVDFLENASTKEYCYFRIKYIECRQKMVTPLYQNIRVTETESYSPNTAELISDTIFFPLTILIGGKFDGEHTKVDKSPTGNLVEGETKTDGIIRMPDKPLSNTTFHVRANERSLDSEKTDSQGILRIPLKPIVDCYLIDKKVKLNLRTQDINLSKTLPIDFLEKALNLVYELDWK
jgi:hypothetical protein